MVYLSLSLCYIRSMKLFILSDIHGSLPSAQMAIDQFRKSKADFLVILGDVLYHGPRNPLPQGYDPAEVAKLLNTCADEVIAVRGNCDSEVDQMVLDFNISDDYTMLSLKDRLVYLSHGHIYNPDNLPPAIRPQDVFLFGHIHLPIIEKTAGYYIGNPGSCTFPKEENPPSYALLDNDSFVIYDLLGHKIASLEFDD